MADGTTDDGQKTIEELQKELEAATKRYENLTTAHEKLKDDLRSLKASQSDANELQKQIEKHVQDKTKLLKEKDELQAAFDGYRKQVQEKNLKVTVLATLGEVTKSPETALKLLDLSAIELDEQGQPTKDSLTAAIDALKVSDPILFGEGSPAPKTPSIKPAIERQTQSAYEIELAAAVKKGSKQEYEAVLAKYGIGS